jgi:hypothetical protein
MNRPLRYIFLISLGLLVASALGLAGVLVLGMAFFTYRGNGMDWIYPVGGLAALVLPVSAVSVTVTGAIIVIQKFVHKRRISN